MRDRGKLTRALLVAAALGGVAFVVSRRIVRPADSAPATPPETSAAIDEGIALGNAHVTPTPEWIPIGTTEEVVGEIPESAPDAGIAAPA